MRILHLIRSLFKMKEKKRCFKCRKIKELKEYYTHSRMKDGLLNKCKDCTKKDVKENIASKKEYYRAYERERANLPKRVKAREEYLKTRKGKEASRRGKAAWVKRNKDKRRAHSKVSTALRNGTLKKEACKICGSSIRVEGHHEDYNKPLCVIWLCPKHHSELHKKKRRGGQ